MSDVLLLRGTKQDSRQSETMGSVNDALEKSFATNRASKQVALARAVGRVACLGNSMGLSTHKSSTLVLTARFSTSGSVTTSVCPVKRAEFEYPNLPIGTKTPLVPQSHRSNWFTT